MFSYRERRGVLYLLLLILIIALCVDMVKRDGDQTITTTIDEKQVAENPADSTYLFAFDPNTATIQDFRRMGLQQRVAISIIRWRSSGKIFRIKEELAETYNMTDSIYDAIEPYIKIGKEFIPQSKAAVKNFESTPKQERRLTPLSPFTLDTVSVEYLRSAGVFSTRQAEVFIKFYRMGGMDDMDGVRECYVVSDSTATLLEKYIVFPPRKDRLALVDINKADSTELRGVYGIGEKSVVAIINYRQRLGGFYSVEQLSEIKVITESNFEQIIRQISCDSCDISKIDVNFAVAEKLNGHPYISSKAYRRLLATRQIKGGWSSIAEMTEDKIFTEEEARRLRPYVRFEEYTKLR